MQKDLSLVLLSACSAAAQYQRTARCLGTVFGAALLLWYGRRDQPRCGRYSGVRTGDRRGQETYEMVITERTQWQDHDEKTTSDPATLAVGSRSVWCTTLP